jgi:hypothetical protein
MKSFLLLGRLADTAHGPFDHTVIMYMFSQNFETSVTDLW